MVISVSSNNLKIMKKTLMVPEKFRKNDYNGKACFSHNYIKYGSFENFHIMLNILNNLPLNENICNELILENSKVKPYLDCEWIKSDFPDLDPDYVKMEIKEKLISIFDREFSVEVKPKEIIFAKCHRNKNDGYKFSFHVVVNTKNTVCFKNATYASFIAKELRNVCSFDKSIIDLSVYKKTQNIRMVGHCKMGEFDSPFIGDDGVDHLDYLITNIGTNFNLLDCIPEQRDNLYKGLSGVKTFDLSTDATSLNEILEKIRQYHPTAIYERTDTNGFHQFNYTDRTEKCFSDEKRTHDQIGFYAYIDTISNNIHLGCHSANCVGPDNKKIMKNIATFGADKILEFEKVHYDNTFNIDNVFIKRCINDGAIGISNLFQKMYLSPKRIKWIEDAKQGISYFWNGKIWEEDNCLYLDRLLVLTVVRVLRNYVESLSQDTENSEIISEKTDDNVKTLANKIISKLNDGNMIFSVLKFVKPLIRDTYFSKIKDIHPHFLSCKNGMIDLYSGDIRAAVPDDNITKCIDLNYDIDADSSVFDAFVRQITSTESGENQEMYDYLKWFIGYAMQGSPKKKLFIIMYGEKGFNGKSLLMNTISDVLEHNATSMDKSVVLEGQKKTAGSHSSEICQLENVRFGILNDTGENATIDDGQVKQLTGITDKLSIREIFGKQKEFIPIFVPFISTNHPIQINLADKAMYERLILMPFVLSFVDDPKKSYEKQADNTLVEKFNNNREGTLKWLVEASMYYNSDPNKPIPQCLKDAKDAYNSRVNNYIDFIRKNLEISPEYQISKKDLLDSFKEYARDNDLKIKKKVSETAFDEIYKSIEIRKIPYYIGVRIKTEDIEEVEE